MAANLRNSKLATVGNRFLNCIPALHSLSLPSLSLRSVHVSVYDKNPEEHVRPAVVPDDVISPHPDKYWSPHPQTGVFGPTTDHKPTSGGEHGVHASADSVLEQRAFFRPLEDLDKPVEN